jgi:AraC family transcriptional activator of tynA and feaB
MSKSTGGASQGRRERADGGSIGNLSVRTTDEVPAAQRVEFWRDEVLRWLEPGTIAPERGPFRAQITRIRGRNADLVELASDAMTASRDLGRCRRDGCDDISFEFMVAGTSDATNDGRQHRAAANDFSVIDCSKPVAMARSRHRNISLMVRRHHVLDSTQGLPSLAGHKFANSGLSTLFKSHIYTTIAHAGDLKADQRAMAIDIATDLALAVLQAETLGRLDPERLPHGFYHAAQSVITRDCTDANLTPLLVSNKLGCSRAALYRAFAGNDQTVAQSIWSSRVQHAERMLTTTRYNTLSITEIAYRSGFLDHSTFNRMFKRRFDMTAEDMRQSFQNG